jgi:hypothetical protein
MSCRWRSVLLSALVGPGAGQFANGEPTKGAAFVLATLAALGVVVLRLVQAVVESLPAELDPQDLGRIWALAWEIQRDHLGEVALPIAAILALWGASIVDAWLIARRPERAEDGIPR